MHLNPPRTYALAIQQYIIDEFDDDNLASSGEPRVGCDLTMELGFPAVKLTIDLPYYKESLFLHHGVGITKAGPGYVARETFREPGVGHRVIGMQHETIPELLAATISSLAIEGPAHDSEKSFSYYFKKAYRFPDEEDHFSNDTATAVMTAVLKGKRVKVVHTKLDDKPDPADPPGTRYTVVMVNNNKALMIEK